MQIKTQIGILIVLIFSVMIGLSQLSYENDIFANTLVLCCNAGYCDGAPCSSPSSIKKNYPTCTDYIADCYACMDFKYQAELCNGTVGEYCLDGEGNPYYGIQK